MPSQIPLAAVLGMQLLWRLAAVFAVSTRAAATADAGPGHRLLRRRKARVRLLPPQLLTAATHPRDLLSRVQLSGYSSFRQARGSSGCGFGVRSSRNELYVVTNRSGAWTVYV